METFLTVLFGIVAASVFVIVLGFVLSRFMRPIVRRIGVNEDGCAIYKLTRDAKFQKIFRSISEDLEKICFSNQEEILEKCRKNISWFGQNKKAWVYALFKRDDGFLVLRVRLNPLGSLDFYIFRFDLSEVWNAKDWHRIIVPESLL